MKRRHNANLPPWYAPKPVVLTVEYEREVQRSTEKLERQYVRAQKRAEQAERRLERARNDPRTRSKKHQIAQLVAEVELRRLELEEYHRMMVSSPASATHRGRKSFRPVPNRNGDAA